MSKTKWFVYHDNCFAQTKLSIATANESKQQLNSSIIYNLDSIARVNERKQRRKKWEIWEKFEKCALPRLELAPFERPVRSPEL